MPKLLEDSYPHVQFIDSAMDEPDKTDKVSNTSDISDDSGLLDCSDLKNVAEGNSQQTEGHLAHDVFFIVGDTKDKFSAHKSKLESASNTFRDLLQTSDTHKNEFDLPEIRAEAFREVLRHIYHADEQLNIDNVICVLHAADYFTLSNLKLTCQTFLQKYLEINNACKLLVEARLYDCQGEERIIISFLEKNLRDVLQSTSINCLSRSLLNEVLTLHGEDVNEILKKQVADQWARNQCIERRLDVTDDNIMKSLHGCFYVDRDNSESHRYVMDSLTTRNLFEDKDDSEVQSKSGSLTPVSSTASLRSSPVPMFKRLSHMWPDLEKITRLQEASGSDINDANHPDAITFTVDQALHLYGFSIYGPTKQQEGKYQVDLVLQEKKKVIVMETIFVKGAGVILPVILEKPVRIEKNSPYTLEIYIKGPESYRGVNGLAQVQNGSVLFTFSNAEKVKRNRTDVSKGQIPGFYFLLQ
ncbi:unnamed protein product [Candidula unifasciata]|uniref:BTB domain-containing protein n=1 Tax=Candidula unifasciata TaxID=100452 RepID=A0A8S3ZRE4_9EUPU|nr:unnamed protein product [Candidula unifasciata]